jgi:hypothetical protein
MKNRLCMKFVVEYGGRVQERVLTYTTADCAFSMESFTSAYELVLVLNKLNLALVDSRVAQIDGFCGFGDWVKSDYEAPEYKRESLKVEHDLKNDFAYGVYDGDLPTYVNTESGWICIGDPQKSGKAVEFINDCVAVIDTSQELVALWLKPQALPEL